MGVSTIILFSLLMCGVKALDTSDSLAALATRVRLVEGEIHAWKLTAVNSEIKLMNRFELLESSLKEELTGRFLPPLIKPLVRLAIKDIMKGDYIGSIISGHVLEEVQALKASGEQTKTQLKGVIQQLRRVELDRDTYRKSLRKQRHRLTKDIRALQVQLNHTVADLDDARRMNSDTKRKIIGVTEGFSTLNTSSAMMRNEVESCMDDLKDIRLKLPTDIQSLTTQLNQTKEDILDSKEEINSLTQDFNTLNRSSVMMRNEVESCMDGLQEIRLKLPTDIHSLTTQLNQTREDLMDTKGIISDLTEDLMTLNISCGMRKKIKPSDRNETSLTTSSLSQMSLTTTAASTDPSPSNTVPPAPVTTQHSDVHASTTDASEDLTPSSTAPPAPETTRDSDALATPSAAAGRDLFDASKDGDLGRVKRILSAGHVDINYRGGWNRTPVMEAAWYGHRDVVEFLVGRGADVSLVDRVGDNILHYACYNGDVETVKLILDLDVVDVNARNNNGWTAADYARGNRHQRVLDLLVSRGAH
ncbi:uncharacterized protein [Haliotis asinina]|uniref:uncharacterized protein n=1 Tax=Haliotis asinina TaxID=109174 RepID=UPI003531B8B2